MKRGHWVGFILVLVAFGVLLVLLLVTSNPGSIFVVPTQVIPTATTTQPPALPSDTPTALPTGVPTPDPPKEFTICQAEEPNTLFIYGGPSPAALNVLEAIYDGPIDTRGYQFQPVILEKLPSLADGDAVLQTVEVREGDKVVDVNNDWVVELLPGVTVFNADGQEVTFEEGGVVTMTQMVVTFRLRADVGWADGQPVTADDSRYSFELAGALIENLADEQQWFWNRTLSYDVLDEHTIVWTSVPGYRDLGYFYGFPYQTFYLQNFYHPLPQHVWGQVSASFLLDAEVARRKPLGWGPFAIEEWVTGERITLVRNPHYFRAAEGLPYLDRLTFRFVPSLRQALDWLAAGECDLIARDAIEGGDTALLLEAADAGMVQLIVSPSNEWEHLDFGIDPAEWVRRPDFFGDKRVRQAIASCVDRERIARESYPYADTVVAHSYVAPEHPLYAGDRLHRWDYDPASGRSLLEEVGWRDEDGDDIREAHGVADVANRTPFTVTLFTTGDHSAHEQAAHILVENLAACGVGLMVRYLPDEEFFADGPDGPVFGRQFDLVLSSWLNGLDAPCGLYLSTQVPEPGNWWKAATNNPGYTSADYDAACQSALKALPGMDEYALFHAEAQRIFSHDLPVLPLYFVPKLVATRPEVSGVTLAPGEYLELWNIEAFDVGR
jgi:peptide/nickel transport system substrate-binding protein